MNDIYVAIRGGCEEVCAGPSRIATDTFMQALVRIPQLGGSDAFCDLACRWIRLADHCMAVANRIQDAGVPVRHVITDYEYDIRTRECHAVIRVEFMNTGVAQQVIAPKIDIVDIAQKQLKSRKVIRSTVSGTPATPATRRISFRPNRK